MADRRDFDDIKLIAGADEPLKIGGIKPDDLRDLESDLLSSVDLNDDLLDDLGELSASAARPKKRKSSSLGMLVTLLVLILFGGGAGYAYLNKDMLMPLLMEFNQTITPQPGDLPEVTTGPALTPDAPVIGATAPVQEPVVPPTSDVTVPAVTAVEPPAPDAGFTDGLPQPDQTTNAGLVGEAQEITLSAGSSTNDQAVSSQSVTVPSVPVAPVVPGSVAEPLITPTTPTVGSVSPVVPEVSAADVISDQTAKKPDDSMLGASPSVGAPSLSARDVVTLPGSTVKDAKPVTSPNVVKNLSSDIPKGDEAKVSDLGDLKMPNLPDLQKSMEDKDEFIESKNTLDDLSDMSVSKMNLSPEQKALGLGISVNDSKSPSSKTKTDKAADKGATNKTALVNQKQQAGSMSSSSLSAVPMISDTESNIVMGVNVEEKIASANRALDLERYQAAYDMFSDLYKDNARDERILMGRAVALQKLGRVDEAIGAYDELLAVSPNNPDVMVNALGLVRQKNPTDALVRLMELRQKFPTNATVAAQIGLVNAELQKYDEGIQYLNIAADLESTNPKHFFNMAVISERMGRMDRAIGYYEQALKADALSTNSKNKIDRDMIYDRLSYLRQSAP